MRYLCPKNMSPKHKYTKKDFILSIKITFYGCIFNTTEQGSSHYYGQNCMYISDYINDHLQSLFLSSLVCITIRHNHNHAETMSTAHILQ